MRAHLKTHSGEKLHKCIRCGFESSYASSLSTHLKIYGEEKSNKCNQCDYTCSNENKLRIHLEIHSGKRPYKCNQCEYADVHWRNLGNHQKMHIKRNIQGEANVEKRRRSVFNDLPCLICAKRSANKAGLKDHMRIHMSSQSYPCYLCDKILHRNSELSLENA